MLILWRVKVVQGVLVKSLSDEVMIGTYDYDSYTKQSKRIVIKIPAFNVNSSEVVLKTEEDIQNWLNWKTEDKFWEKSWS